ncbi:hypothetical protein NE237_028114 [Protea cynaroides]|uniref:PB1 domain-containing protein n=1 Tax=Protea cynaroides TaxID=273540 RepID=A0A9Q0GSM8_9MAGN|nr:hypothetical protein NE237_028114 [Protea cynaroides]
MALVGGIDGGEEVATVSPKNRVKFLCSHGGKILPRSSDGQLKYVGGETRVVVIPQLRNKLCAIAEAEVVLRYQLLSEDLDVLVSVRCDDDLNHMLDEYNRHETRLNEVGNTPKLRCFLFPSHPLVVENQMPINNVDNNAVEQRYIDAINGVTSMRRSFSGRQTISSAGSSPRSIIHDGFTVDGLIPNNYHNGRFTGIHRVSSSPSLSSLAQQNHQCHQMQQHARPYCTPSRVHCSYSNGCGHGRLATASSSGWNDIGRIQMGHVPPQQYFLPSRRSSGKWGCSHGQIDEGGSIYRSGEVEKGETSSSMKLTWE